MKRFPSLFILFFLFSSFNLLAETSNGSGKPPYQSNYTASLSVFSNKICKGESFELFFTIDGTAPPFTVTLSRSIAPDTVILVPATGHSEFFSPEATTVYSIAEIMDANQMFGTPTNVIQVDVKENPMPVILGNTNICPGDTIVLDAGPGFETYDWGNGVNTPVLTIGNTAGFNPVTEFTVTVTNLDGCSGSASVSAIISGLELIECNQVQAAASPITEGGAVELIINGGIMPLTATYTSTNASGSYTFTDNDPSFTIPDLIGGDFNLTLSDAIQCEEECNFQIDTCSLTVRELSRTPVSCNGGMDGQTQVELSGGYGRINYDWNDPGITDTTIVDSLVAGIYTLEVEDSLKCRDTIEIVIEEPDVLSISDITVISDTCEMEVGRIEVEAAGGTPSYSFSWSNNSNSADNPDLLSGIYFVTVTDSHFCEFVSSAISVPSVGGGFTFSLAAESVSCYNGNDGAIQIIGLPDSITNIQSDTIDFNGETFVDGLPSGNYVVTAFDDFGCPAENSITVGQPTPLEVAAQVIPDTCDLGVGSITMQVDGGIPGYTVDWENGTSDTTNAGLLSGSYSVTVEDNNGCQFLDSIEVGITGGFDFELEVEDVTCSGAEDGRIQLLDLPAEVANIDWSVDAFDGQSEATGLMPGIVYSVTVVDQTNCSTIKMAEVFEPEPITLEDIFIISDTCSMNTGAISVQASGGNDQYIYEWSNDTSGSSIANLSAGAYELTVTDALGCTQIRENLIVETEGGIDFSFNVGNVSCPGESDGYIFLANVGLPDSILWSVPGFDGSQGAINLAADTYFVTVVDAIGCPTVRNIEVTEPEQLSVVDTLTIITPASCNESTGAISVEAIGGTGSYTLTWSGGYEGSIIENLPAGIYDLTITDSLGCMGGVDGFEVEAVGGLDYTINEVDISCFGQNDGAIEIVDTAGTIITIDWDADNLDSLAEESLPPGTYTATLTDAFDCTEMISVEITEPAILSAIDTLIDPLGCDDSAAGGAIAVEISGGTSPYTYLWSNNEETSSIDSLDSGTYSLTVIDAMDCSLLIDDIVIDSVGLDYSTNKVDILCFGQNDGSIEIIDIDGTITNISWDAPGLDDLIEENLAAGIYNATITDGGNCEETITIEILEPVSPLAISGLTTEPTDCDANSGTASIQVLGGTPPYTIGWSNGGTGPTIENLSSGVYQVIITDDQGCTIIDSAQVDLVWDLDYAVDIMDASCAGANDGAIMIIDNVGSIEAIAWGIPGLSGSDVVGLPAGAYPVTISAGVNCAAMDTLQVGQPAISIQTADDTISVMIGESFPFTLPGQDTFPAGWEFEILTAPNGNLDSQQQQFIYFTDMFFGGLDSFQIEVCASGCETDCDTSWVVVEIESVSREEGNLLLTPNGDMYNETLDFGVLGFSEMDKLDLIVFNINGAIVFKDNDYQNDWKGTCNECGNGSLFLPDGTYFYRLNVETEGEFKGFITILSD